MIVQTLLSQKSLFDKYLHGVSPEGASCHITHRVCVVRHRAQYYTSSD